MSKKKLDLREVAQEETSNTSDARFELCPRILEFSISYDAPTGESFTDTLTSVVMNSDSRLTMQRIIQRLCTGLVYDNLSYAERLRVDAIARAIVQIQEVPDWLNDHIGEDDQLLSEVNSMLVEHENRYFRGNARKSAEGTAEKRVSINSPFFKADGSPE